MGDIDKEVKELNKQLYPTGRAWGYVHGSEQVDTAINVFTDGLDYPFVDGKGNFFVSVLSAEASPSKRYINAKLQSFIRFYEDLLSILNIILPDNDQFDPDDATNWERALSIIGNSGLTLEERKTAILRKLTYPNGISERSTAEFIQDQLNANGFQVFVTENRFSDGGSGWEVIDPDTLTAEDYQFGIGQLGEIELGGQTTGEDYSICANYIDEALDNTYFDEVYLPAELGEIELGEVELGATQLIRDNQLKFTFFVGGSSIPSIASVPLERKNEFRELILRLKPAHSIAFLYIEYV